MLTRTVGNLTFYGDLAQGSQEWLEVRAGKVTCSNALTLMNKGKGACLEANKISLRNLKPNGNFYAERGHVIENEFREKYNESLKEFGFKITECGFITNSDYPDAGYSPDGLIVPTDNPTKIVGLVEFKAYNDIVIRKKDGVGYYALTAKHRNACFSMLSIPPQCIAQCNMAMLLTGAPRVELLLCNPDAGETDSFIKALAASDDPADKAMLAKACPGGGYDIPTPITKTWTIKRNEKIIARLKDKLTK